MFTGEQEMKFQCAYKILYGEGYKELIVIGVDSTSTHFMFSGLNARGVRVILDVIISGGKGDDKSAVIIAKRITHLRDIDCKKMGLGYKKLKEEYRNIYIESTGKPKLIKTGFYNDTEEFGVSFYWAILEMNLDIEKFNELMPKKPSNDSSDEVKGSTELDRMLYFLNSNQYTRCEELGKGSFGRVFKCRKPGAGGKKIKVAVKVVCTRNLTLLNREINANKKADYVKKIIKDAGERKVFEECATTGEVKRISKSSCMALIEFELAEGDINDTKLTKESNRNDNRSQRAIDYNELKKIAVCVLKSLKTLNSNGIAHFDIKPKNILKLKTSSGLLQYKLADFGLAARRPPRYGLYYEETDAHKTNKKDIYTNRTIRKTSYTNPTNKDASSTNATDKRITDAKRTQRVNGVTSNIPSSMGRFMEYNSARGTPAYLAPELRARPSSWKDTDDSVFFKSDVYSLGISLFQMYLLARADAEKISTTPNDIVSKIPKFLQSLGVRRYMPLFPDDPQEQAFLDFIRYLTIFDPKRRPDAKKALRHPFLR